MYNKNRRQMQKEKLTSWVAGAQAAEPDTSQMSFLIGRGAATATPGNMYTLNVVHWKIFQWNNIDAFYT